MRHLALIILFSSPLFLFSQCYPSGIITYRSASTFDSSNIHSTLPYIDELPEAEQEEIKKRMYRTDKWVEYVYFTATTAWSHKFTDMEIPKGRKYTTNVIRTYKDSTFRHSQMMGVGTDTIGVQQFGVMPNSLMPMHLKREELHKLENLQRSNDTCQILSYTCYAYKDTEDARNIFWVTEELNLPPLFTAGFMHPEAPIKGVVLRYEHKYGYAEATNIEYCELNESVLRHTPLLELRPEMLRSH